MATAIEPIPKIIKRKEAKHICEYTTHCRFGDSCKVDQENQSAINRMCILAYGFSLNDEMLKE